MKWEDVIKTCENLGYSPEDLLKLVQVHEYSVSCADRLRESVREKSGSTNG